MRAIDTNVLVRLLAKDDPDQAERARAAFAGGDLFIGMTVLLETEWVLRSLYKFAPDNVAAGLRAALGLPRVVVEEPALLNWALDRMISGMDFADALHLGKAEGCSAFLSFDRDLARLARRTATTPVEEP